MNKDVQAYNKAQSTEDKEICNTLAEEINRNLPDAENESGMRTPFGFWMATRLSVTAS